MQGELDLADQRHAIRCRNFHTLLNTGSRDYVLFSEKGGIDVMALTEGESEKAV
jgi:hypothetical protein